jgi:hypothetical protein
MPTEAVPEPWASFLREIDSRLEGATELHCLGGFVVTTVYDMARSTADVDVLAIVPGDASRILSESAGKGSDLHRRHGVYIDTVAVATVPEDYEQRLTEIFPGAFRHLRLLAFDPYDLALSKLERNIQRDRDDVRYLARKVPFELDVLRERYEKEMRPYLAMPEREDLTLRLWVEMIQEERGG